MQSYQYDQFGRLTGADTTLGDYRYDYDTVGNRTEKQHTDQNSNTETETYTYAKEGEGNRLVNTGTSSEQDNAASSYAYNEAGSPIRAGELSYDYNQQQRPTKVYKTNSGNNDESTKTLIAEYSYNRFGERIKKVVYSNSKKPKVTYYLYDGHSLTAEADESGKITAQYLYYKNQPFTKLEGKQPYAIHTDHLGTPRAATDSKGKQVWQADYSPFGQANITTQQITLNLRFPGQYEDQETGKYYNYLRTYDPDTGRYATSDPIGLGGGINTYAYVEGDPLSKIDPLGLAVYLAGRDLNGVPVGTHLYLVIIPDDKNAFTNGVTIGSTTYRPRDLGIGTPGFVIGTHKINGRLLVKPFETADFTATRQFLVPGIFTNPFQSDYDPEFRRVTPNVCFIGDKNKSQDTLLIENIIKSVNNYAVNESVQNIRYPTALEQLQPGKGFVNSNSWANSVIDSVFSSVSGGRNFNGLDALGGNRLPGEYFQQNPGKLPKLNP